MNKLLPFLAFSILLLVPVGIQDVYGTIETDFPIGVTCTNPPNVQLCVPPFSANVETDSELMVKYTVTGHCSSVRVHVFLDGNFVTTSEFLGWVNTPPPPPFDVLPLMTPIIDLGPVSSGSHQIDIQAEGQVSGCNSGGLGVWSGTLTTFTEPILPEPPLSCGPGTIEVNNECVCEQQNNQCVGGVLIDTDTVSLLAGTIGIDPLLIGLIGITIGGLAVQAVWFIHRRRKSENS